MNARLVNILISHAEEAYLQKSLDMAMHYTNQAMELTNRLNHKDAISQIFILKGKIQNSRGQYTQDEQLLDEAESYFVQASRDSSPNAEILLNCGYVYLNKKNYDLAHRYFDDAERIAESKSDLDMIIQSMSGKSKVLIAEKKFKDAFELAEQAIMLLDDEVKKSTRLPTYVQFLNSCIKMASFPSINKYSQAALQLANELKDVENKATILNAIGIYHGTRSEYKKAFESFLASKKYSEGISFHEMTAKCLTNLATILSNLSNYKEAFDNNYQVYSTPHLYNALDEYAKGILLYNLGCIGHKNNLKNEAVAYLKEAIELGEITNNPRLIGRSQYDLMRIYLEEGEYNKAISLAEKTIAFYNTVGDITGSESHLANIAEISLIQKNYEQAIKFALKAEKRSNQVQNHRTRRRSYKLLSDIYKALGDYKKAHEYLELVFTTSEILYKDLRQRTMLDLERKYETNKKEKEIELLKSKMEIQSLELEHTKQLTEKNEKVATAQEEMRQYTYAVSHDLKEPLRMIGSFSKLLQRKYNSTADASDIEFFNYINNGVKRMSDLLNALLEYGRVGKHDENKEWVDLKELMEDIEATYYVKIKEEKAKLIINEMPMIYTNRLMIFQLLQNLVANGLKFKKIDTPSIVQIKYKEQEDHHLITISDNGIGISNEYKERIFQIFARLHKKDAYEGTGIGLAMCKKIINHLKGTIDLKSDVGVGTTFFVSLPKANLSEINTIVED